MNKVIYFDKDCMENAQAYAQYSKEQKIADKISNGIEKTAIILCSIVSIVAVGIMLFLFLA